MISKADILPTAAEADIIERNAMADVRQLALSLKSSADIRPQYVLNQIAGRQAIGRKVPSWSGVQGMVYPVRLSVEQCSSEPTAQYKASVIKRLVDELGVSSPTSMADLTGGFGVDFSFVAPCFDEKTYIERNEELATIVEHNMAALGMKDIRCVCGDGVEFVESMDGHLTCIFLDPARRDEHGGKTVHIEDCTPNLIELEQMLLSKADIVVAKLSPMLDVSEALASLKQVDAVHVVSVDNECKELLLVMRHDVSADPKIYTLNGDQSFAFSRSEEREAECVMASSVGRYLYEPNASVMKAGAFKVVGGRYGVKKLHASSHLYTSDELVESFPGRLFEVMSVGSMGKNTLPSTMQGLQKANITVRNFPQKVDDIRKKLKLKEGGEDYVFATTLTGDKKVLVHCRKVM